MPWLLVGHFISATSVIRSSGAKDAGQLLENLPALWEQANLAERRQLLLTMLEAVYVDTIEEKAIVAVRPKPAFRPLFEVATTREGSDVVLINEPPQAFEPEAADLCFWWRRGRVELHQQHGLAVLVAATSAYGRAGVMIAPKVKSHRSSIPEG